jgi:futalosine hydrolase
VTGDTRRALALRSRYPDAVAEAMEGVGVYRAATAARVPFAELRTISNQVGPRNTDQWQIGTALASLTVAFDALLFQPVTSGVRT